MTLLNHTMAQQTPDVLEGERTRPREKVNVGDTERWISGLAGGALAAFGLSRRSVPGAALAAIGAAMVYRGVSGQCNVYKALGIDTSGRAAEPEDYFDHGIHVAAACTVAKSAAELYRYWRNFENLPRIMRHLESVRVIDDRASHWVAKAPSIAGGKVEWDAEIINDEPNMLIAWRSLPSADVDNAGSVRFVPAPGDRETDVKVVLDYIPPAGHIGRIVAKLFGEEPQQQIQDDLDNFKRAMEGLTTERESQ